MGSNKADLFVVSLFNNVCLIIFLKLNHEPSERTIGPVFLDPWPYLAIIGFIGSIGLLEFVKLKNT